MNCICLLCCLALLSGNGCGCNSCGCNSANGNARGGNPRGGNSRNGNGRRGNGRGNESCGCEEAAPLPQPFELPPRSRDDEMMPPRGFAGYQEPETCGCESKSAE